MPEEKSASAMTGMKYAGRIAHAINFILFLKTPKALKTDWNNPSFFWIKAVVLEITTSELQKKIFAFNNF